MPVNNTFYSMNPTVIKYTSDKDKNILENKKEYYQLNNIVIHNPSESYTRNHISITIYLVPLETIVISL
jgi:carbonic anhydrase